MATVYDVPAHELIDALTEELKKIKFINPPDWALFVKTGAHKERVPEQDDWWYIRAASILRQIYIRGPVGVKSLRVKYGGRRNRGSKPEKRYNASGKIIRTIVQQLEDAGFVEKTRNGRKITSKGCSVLDKIASRIARGNK